MTLIILAIALVCVGISRYALHRDRRQQAEAIVHTIYDQHHE